MKILVAVLALLLVCSSVSAEQYVHRQPIQFQNNGTFLGFGNILNLGTGLLGTLSGRTLTITFSATTLSLTDLTISNKITTADIDISGGIYRSGVSVADSAGNITASSFIGTSATIGTVNATTGNATTINATTVNGGTGAFTVALAMGGQNVVTTVNNANGITFTKAGNTYTPALVANTAKGITVTASGIETKVSGSLLHDSNGDIILSATITPTTVQAGNGSVGAPAYTFAAETDTGLYRIGTDNLGLTVGGTKIVDVASTGATITGNASATLFLSGDGAVGAPAFSFTGDADTGMYRIGANNIGVAVNGAKVLDIGTGGLTVTGTTNSTTVQQGGNQVVDTITPLGGLASSESGGTVQITPTYSSTLGSVSGLYIQRDASTVTQINITVTSANLSDAAGHSVTVRPSATYNLDTTANGAVNRLDAGTRGNNQWWHLYIIYNGTTIGSLASLSATAPTMPSGYTWRCRVGTFATDGSAAIHQFFTTGNTTHYDVPRVLLSAGTSTTFADLDASTMIPPTSRLGNFQLDYTPASANQTLEIRPNGGASTVGPMLRGTVASAFNSGEFWCPTDSAQGIEYRVNSGGTGYIRVAGYVEN